MTLTVGLKRLGFLPQTDFICQDDGEGPYIAEWLSATPQPSMSDVIAAAAEGEIANAKAIGIASINAACEAARNRVAPYVEYIDTEYQILAAQADAYVAAGMPENPVGLDMLVESAADSGLTVAQEAAVVRGKRDAYITLLNATRRLRRQGQAAIDAASDIETIHSVRDEYVAQLASL